MIEEAFALVDEFIRRETEREGPPGLALAVTDAERTLATRTYGFADLSSHLPVQPMHLFQIGSIGKSFAAFIVMQEVEANHLQLDVPVTEYLPWFRVPSRFPPITLHHLLTHTAGIASGGEAAPDAIGEVFLLRNGSAAWAPGSRFYYSNAGYKTVGLVLERVLRRPYAEIVRERIFAPLGMDASEPAIVNAVRPRSAVGYRRLYDDRLEHRSHPWVPAPWSESTSADGSILSTAEDMAAYVRMILNRGRGPGGPVVSDPGFEYMIQPFAEDPDAPDDHFGFGLINRDENGRRFLGHSGGTIGYTAGMWTENGLGVLILQNSERGAWWLAPYVLEVVRAAIDGREPPPVPAAPDPTVVENAADYVGTYRSAERTFTLEQDGLRLLLDGVALEQIGTDAFQVPHPGFDRYMIVFGRESRTVTEAAYGGEVFYNVRHTGFVTPAPHPPEWDTFTGHYRSHNPWCSNLRAFVRNGTLFLAFHNVDFGGSELALTPVPDGSFQVRDWPEWVSFDTVVGGLAQRAVFQGEEFWRTFAP